MSLELLYISPVIPAVTGNGLAMRAGMVLEALAARHSVSLLVNPLYPPAGPVPEFFARMCRRVAIGPNAYRWQSFDVIHVFRLASLPTAQPFLNGRIWNRSARRHLDIDDIESETHRRLARLYHSNGDKPLALMEERQAARSAALEAEVLSQFDRIYVCSAVDREKLTKRTRGEICVLPNSVRPRPPPRRLGPPRDLFLFVGTLGYYPNEDACRYSGKRNRPSPAGLQVPHRRHRGHRASEGPDLPSRHPGDWRGPRRRSLVSQRGCRGGAGPRWREAAHASRSSRPSASGVR